MQAPKRRWLPRRFPPTREGWWFLVATLLVGAAAVNAGMNLLFLIFGMMLFMILASGVMSELALRDLVVVRRAPAAMHAGTPFLMGIAVKNAKTRLPTFSLEVEDLVGERPVERRCYFLKIPAGRQQDTAYRHVIKRRGRHRPTGFRLSTRFPFGFIRKSRDIEAPSEWLVYPALMPVADRHLPPRLADALSAVATRASRGGEFAGLREFRIGDDPRFLHWPSSARRGRLMLRETEEEIGRLILVRLEDRAGADDAAFEEAVSLAASLALKLLRGGLAVGLETRDAQVRPASAPGQITDIFKALALVERGAGPAKNHGSALVVTVRPGAGRATVDLRAEKTRRTA